MTSAARVEMTAAREGRTAPGLLVRRMSLLAVDARPDASILELERTLRDISGGGMCGTLFGYALPNTYRCLTA